MEKSTTSTARLEAHDAAPRTIESVEILRLSVADQRRLAEAIVNPPAPAPALRRAFNRRRKLFGPA